MNGYGPVVDRKPLVPDDPESVLVEVLGDPEECEVLFVGEAPGSAEDALGRPFLGKSGACLKDAIRTFSGIPESLIRYTNSVRCRPSKNKLPDKAVTHCGGALLQEIEDVDPKLVVLLGNTAMKAVLGEAGITAKRGRVTEKGGRKYINVYHPSYVIRDKAVNGPQFARDIEKAGQVFRGEWKQLRMPYKVPHDPAVALKMIESLHQEDIACFDLETTGLDIYGKAFKLLSIGLCGLSYDDKNEPQIGEAFSVPIDHPEDHWHLDKIRLLQTDLRVMKGAYQEGRGGDEKTELLDLMLELEDEIESWRDAGRQANEDIKAAVVKLLQDAEVAKMGHNIKYDYQCVFKALGIEPLGLLIDTMLMHWCLDEQKRTHALKRIAHEYTPFGGYDDALKDVLKRPDVMGVWKNIPLEFLLPYNAMDAYVTAYVFKVFGPLMKKEKVWPVYNKILTPAIRATARMEIAGVAVDIPYTRALKKKYEDRRDFLISSLEGLEVVAEAEEEMIRRLRAKHGDRIARYQEHLEEAPKQLNVALNAIADAKNAGKRIRKKDLHKKEVLERRIDNARKYLAQIDKEIDETATFNWGSTKHLQVLFFDVMDLAPVNETLTGYSTDEAFLARHKNRKICKNLSEIRSIDKLLGTYINPILVDHNVDPEGAVVKPDGLVHPQWLMHGTETGRYSCGAKEAGKGDGTLAAYPLQTLPRDPGPPEPEVGIRRQFVSRFKDGKIVQRDYKQIEFIIMGIVANDQQIIAAAKSGKDLHKFSASLIFDKPIEDVTPAERQQCKAAVSFGLLYGRSAYALAKDFGISQRKAEELIDRFFEIYHKVAEYLENIEAEAARNGCVWTKTGRKRRLHKLLSLDENQRDHALREAYNSPVQGTASDLTLSALTEVSEILYGDRDHPLSTRKTYRSVVVSFNHDDFKVDCPPEEVDEVDAIMRDVMENRPFGWLICPTKTDAKIGPSFAE